MFEKIARAIEISFDISEEEKKKAEQAKEMLEKISSSLDESSTHLDIIYVPFKKSTETFSSEAVTQFRGALHLFQTQVKENYNKIKIQAFFVISLLENFGSDFKISELISALRISVEDLEGKVNELLELLEDYRSETFKDDIIGAIDSLRQETKELKKIIKERIIAHLDANILTNDWVSALREELNLNSNDKIPYITQLFESRQKQLNNK